MNIRITQAAYRACLLILEESNYIRLSQETGELKLDGVMDYDNSNYISVTITKSIDSIDSIDLAIIIRNKDLWDLRNIIIDYGHSIVLTEYKASTL